MDFLIDATEAVTHLVILVKQPLEKLVTQMVELGGAAHGHP